MYLWPTTIFLKYREDWGEGAKYLVEQFCFLLTCHFSLGYSHSKKYGGFKVSIKIKLKGFESFTADVLWYNKKDNRGALLDSNLSPIKSLSPVKTGDNHISHILMLIVRMKSNTKQATGTGNNGDPWGTRYQEQRCMFTATSILLSFEKQIVTNIPYSNKLKSFRQIN